MLDGLRARTACAELCGNGRHRAEPVLHLVEGVHEGKASALAGDTARAATTGEVPGSTPRSSCPEGCVADQTLEHRLLKKEHDHGWGTPQACRLTSTPRGGPHSANLCRELCRML